MPSSDVAMKNHTVVCFLEQWRQRVVSTSAKAATTHAEGDTIVKGSKQEEMERVKEEAEEAAQRMSAQEAEREKADEAEAARKRAVEVLQRVQRKAQKAARRESGDVSSCREQVCVCMLQTQSCYRDDRSVS